MLDGLVKDYTLPEDMATKLQTEPEQVLPYLAARVHQNIVNRLTEMLQSQLPVMVRNVQAIDKSNEASKKAFYDAWPQLNAKDHERAVLEAGKMFRQLNPTADSETAIKTIGKLVCESLGIAMAPAAPGAPPAPPPAPAFRPAGGGVGGQGGGAPAQDNDFAALAEEMLRDGE